MLQRGQIRAPFGFRNAPSSGSEACTAAQNHSGPPTSSRLLLVLAQQNSLQQEGVNAFRKSHLDSFASPAAQHSPDAGCGPCLFTPHLWYRSHILCCLVSRASRWAPPEICISSTLISIRQGVGHGAWSSPGWVAGVSVQPWGRDPGVQGA